MRDMFTGEEVNDAVSSDWTKDIVAALQDGKERHLYTIYERVARHRLARNSSLPPTYMSTIRCHLQRHCKESPQFIKGGEDLFRRITDGVWQLKK